MLKSDLPSIIGINGLINSGKDTTASLILEKFPDRYKTYAFAEPLKEAIVILFGFTRQQLEDRVLKEQIDPFWGFSPRNVIQLLGTEYGRNMIRKDVWIKRAQQEFEKNLKNGYGTIITDVRFNNEAEWIRSINGSLIISVINPYSPINSSSHESEQGINIFYTIDKTIINDKTLGLRYLRSQIDNVFS